MTSSMASGASLLPGWTVGDVLTHLARNAEAMVRRVEAAERGEVVDQYIAGAEGRAAEIEAGAGRSVEELIADVLSWSRRLDAIFASLPDRQQTSRWAATISRKSVLAPDVSRSATTSWLSPISSLSMR